MYHHKREMAVLWYRNVGYCLTNGATSYLVENDPDREKKMIEHVTNTTITVLYVIDVASGIRWRLLNKRLNKNNELSVIVLEKNARDCPTCHKNCVRWVDICGLNIIKKVNVDPIPHGSCGKSRPVCKCTRWWRTREKKFKKKAFETMGMPQVMELKPPVFPKFDEFERPIELPFHHPDHFDEWWWCVNVAG
ncbi:hypothetical protein HNY73_010533 [Argiope bruennichi]|uniref:Uncharacterized protein n=1 Tax=Argiope bruennichi TaxID=94029 RepID=A0A8T0F1B5_ARGBR|nr:hypothetical protein HNY73_010533 [Argiope bruennichi]